MVVALGVGGCVASPMAQATVGPAPGRAPAIEPAEPPRTTEPASVTMTGRASWYGSAHQGRLTANGEAFDMNAMTAAHPSLPFGTRLRVVNLENDRAVEVRINDRGPRTPGRVLDLSYAAARALGAVGSGVIPVRLTVLSDN
jgi:peptidoglycan lytic transglycosylase